MASFVPARPLLWSSLVFPRQRFEFPARASEVSDFVAAVCSELPDGVPTESVAIAVGEALANAIVHGALRLRSTLRDAGQVDRFLERLVRREARYGARRRVSVDVITHTTMLFVIVRDSGPGFDAARARPNPGRGLWLIRELSDESTWNESGNEVTLRWNRKS